MTRSPSRRLAVTLAAVACAAALSTSVAMSSAAAGQPRLVQHVVRGSDSIESIAAEYYGNRSLAQLILEANGLQRGAHLHAGQRLRIPSAYHYRLKKNETLESVATRLLADKRRAPFLALWSGLKPGDKTHDGQDLLVPFQLVHKAAAPESLSGIAKTYYGDAGQSKLLTGYNFRSSPMLAPGDKIVVPIANVRVRAVHLSRPVIAVAATHPEESQRRQADEEAALAKRVAARLAEAEKSYLDGNYTEVPAALTKLLSEEDPSESQLVEIHRLLAFAYVALGADEVAVREFHEVLERDPEARLDEATVSPKIRAAFDRAKQAPRTP